jgi:uncharacterized FAD-dependent dehydrogenase
VVNILTTSATGALARSLRPHYDIAIVGGGIGGLFAAHRLSTSNQRLSICILEKGAPHGERHCAMVARDASQCVNCRTCAIMEGLAGTGMFRNSKFVVTGHRGGWLTDYMPESTVLDYVEQADRILVSYGATTDRYRPSRELIRDCLAHGMNMSSAQVKHFGTDGSFATIARLIRDLESRVDIFTRANVLEVIPSQHRIEIAGGRAIMATGIIFAVGRSGSHFFQKWCRRYNVPLVNNQVDIGVRV